MTDRKGSNHGLLGLKLFFFFIRMFCSMPFILDDRKLLCCQDAAAEIEGRSHISILQLESYSNEFAERGKKSRDKQMRINRVPLSSAFSLSLSSFLLSLGGVGWWCMCVCVRELFIFHIRILVHPCLQFLGSALNQGTLILLLFHITEHINILEKFTCACRYPATHDFLTRVCIYTQTQKGSAVRSFVCEAERIPKTCTITFQQA